MKTSKRLLSILLMLTMLLSMFTVMASADTPDDTPTTVKTIKLVVRDHGSVQINGNTAKDGDRVKVGDVLNAVPDDGYTAKWTYGVNGLPLSGNPITVTSDMVDSGCDVCAVFTESGEQPEPSTDVALTVNIVTNSVAGATVYNGTTDDQHKVTSGAKLTFTAEELKTAMLLASADGQLNQDYKVEWKLNGDTASTGAYYDLSDLTGTSNTMIVTFTPVAPAPVKHTLALNQTTGGTIKCNNVLTSVQLAKGETATLTAEANDGYTFKEWKVTTGDAMVEKPKSATTTITMGDTDATVKAVFEKTYTLTIEVRKIGIKTPGKIVYDGKEHDKLTFTQQIEGAEINLKAVANKGYKFLKWEITGTGATVTSDANATVKIGTSDVKLTAVFAKKTDGDDLDLELDISGWSHGDVYAKKNSGTSKKVTKNNLEYTLSEDDKVKFTAYPDSGFKAVWQLEDGKKYTGDTFTVDYEDMDDEDCVLYLSFVRKSSTVEDDYPTLTFDITGKHGTVYRGTREYEHGDVISIKKNDKMTFKAKTDKGYVAVWTYKGDTYVGDEYTVKMGANDAKLYVEFMDKDDIRLTELPFRDVSKRDWYYDDVVYVYRKGYMDGMSSTRFGGELNTTRGQIVTILWRLTGEPRATKRNPFTDVSSKQYYYDAISWAYDAGVVDGFDARTFKPDQNVTREQLAAILYRYAKYMNLSTSGSAYLAKYRDADKIANWAYDAMAWANYRGLINGTSATRIDPKGYATRAQIAAILHRFAVEYGA